MGLAGLVQGGDSLVSWLTLGVYAIQAAIALIALVYVIRQLTALRKQIEISNKQTIYIGDQAQAAQQQINELQKTVNDSISSRAIEYYSQIIYYLDQHPRVRDVFHAHSQSYLTLSEEQKETYTFMGLAMSLFEPLWRLKEDKRMQDETWDAWDNWISGTVLRMPDFESFWANERTFYRDSFQQYINGKLGKNDKLGYEPAH